MENLKPPKPLFNEASLERVHAHTLGRSIGMITGHRTENDETESGGRNIELEGQIRNAGYGFIKVVGRQRKNHAAANAQTADECAYLVVGKQGDDEGRLLSFLQKHGEQHRQGSILHTTHDGETRLHGTSEGMWPGKGEAHDVGKFHPDRIGEFLTLMKGSQDFAFESIRFINGKSFFSREESDF